MHVHSDFIAHFALKASQFYGQRSIILLNWMKSINYLIANGRWVDSEIFATRLNANHKFISRHGERENESGSAIHHVVYVLNSIQWSENNASASGYFYYYILWLFGTWLKFMYGFAHMVVVVRGSKNGRSPKLKISFLRPKMAIEFSKYIFSCHLILLQWRHILIHSICHRPLPISFLFVRRSIQYSFYDGSCASNSLVLYRRCCPSATFRLRAQGKHASRRRLSISIAASHKNDDRWL